MRVVLEALETNYSNSHMKNRHNFEYREDVKAGDHIDYWRYSPENCEQLIETRF